MTTTNLTSPDLSQEKANLSWKLVGFALLAMLVAGAANVGLYFAAGQFFPEVTSWAGAGVAQIMGANNAYITLAAIVFAVVSRKSANPTRTFLWVAVLSLLLSFGMPIAAGFGYAAGGAPAAGLATVVTLCLMHVMSFLVTVALFSRISKR